MHGKLISYISLGEIWKHMLGELSVWDTGLIVSQDTIK